MVPLSCLWFWLWLPALDVGGLWPCLDSGVVRGLPVPTSYGGYEDTASIFVLAAFFVSKVWNLLHNTRCLTQSGSLFGLPTPSFGAQGASPQLLRRA